MNRTRQYRRRANVMAVTAASMIGLLGFSALAIDVGQMCMVKGELQRSADAAALAGAGAIISDNLLKENYDPMPDVTTEVQRYALSNPTGGVETSIPTSGILAGHLVEPLNSAEAIDPQGSPINAVRTTVLRNESTNGGVQTFFARIFGFETVELQASATAIIDDRFAGFQNPQSLPGPLLPFTISKNYYEEQRANGVDDWTWDGFTQQPVNTPDDIGEIWIYPEDNNSNGGGNGNGNGNGGGGGSGSGGGNFGTLNIGLNQQGTQPLGDQIAYGVDDQDLINEIGTDTIMFYDEFGQPVSYDMTGNPGLSGGLSAYVELRIGDVVSFFIHDGVVDDGSNAVFNIIDMRFGRVMEIDLTGNQNNKRLVIQPVVYNGPGIIMDPNAQSSGGTIFALQLVR